MKIYTRTGDAGLTGLYGGGRVRKNDLRIAAYGAVDELNATLGVCRSPDLPPALDEPLARLQHEMFALGAELASPGEAAPGSILIDDADIAAVEAARPDRRHVRVPFRPVPTWIQVSAGARTSLRAEA